MTTCQNCNANNPEDSTFCANCGAKIVPTAEAQPSAAQPVMAETVKKGLPKHNGKATAGLVLGIVGIVFSWLPLIGGPATIIGIIMSAIGLKSQKTGMAIGGLVTSIIGLIITIIVFFVSAMSVLSILSNTSYY